jgi:hypothetical protein
MQYKQQAFDFQEQATAPTVTMPAMRQRIETLADYVAANEAIILAQNPPRNCPAYAEDPIAMWRYYMRCFGAGLAVFDAKAVNDVVSTLYSRWFVRSEFHSKMPKIDNHDFVGWIYAARQEQIERNERRFLDG